MVVRVQNVEELRLLASDRGADLFENVPMENFYNTAGSGCSNPSQKIFYNGAKRTLKYHKICTERLSSSFRWNCSRMI